MNKVAIYPGSFDPITSGHVDILERFSSLFSKIYVVVGNSSKKSYLFDLEERKKLAQTAISHLKHIEVVSHDGLTVEIANQLEANFILRGIRSGSDFEYEKNMANMNQRLAPNIETVLVYSRAELGMISSSLIKEVASLGGSLKGLVPINVEEALIKKLR